MSLYRACCCTQERCCSVWCGCPDQITVSFCKVTFEKEVYSCLFAEGYCYPPVGDLIGSSVRHVTVKDLVFEKKTGVDPNTLCSNCCWYEPVVGSGQTGTVTYGRDEWYVWCAEPDGEECVFGNRTCVANNVTHQLSGSSTGWNQTIFNGALFVDCCDATKCESGSVRARLIFNLEGVATGGTLTDCCTQTTTPLTTVVRFEVEYNWECTNRSKMIGSCPCDLLSQTGTGTISGEVQSCLDGLTAECPCPGGQGTDYGAGNPCIVTQSNSIYYCVETDENVQCVPAGNGYITEITGCD